MAPPPVCGLGKAYGALLCSRKWPYPQSDLEVLTLLNCTASWRVAPLAGMKEDLPVADCGTAEHCRIGCFEHCARAASTAVGLEGDMSLSPFD